MWGSVRYPRHGDKGSLPYTRPFCALAWPPTGTSASGSVHIQVGGANAFNATTAQSQVLVAGTTVADFTSSYIRPYVSNLSWSNDVSSPTILQASDTTASATGDTLTIQAQNATTKTTDNNSVFPYCSLQCHQYLHI